MALTYEIRPELECIFVTLAGVIDDHDVLTAQEDMFKDPAFRGHYSRLIDASLCERLAIDALTVYYCAKCAERRGLRRAALVANSPLTFGLMRMYEGYTPDAECEVFNDVETAMKWLLADYH